MSKKRKWDEAFGDAGGVLSEQKTMILDTINKMKTEVICGGCAGWGHKPKKCTTMRKIRDWAKDVPSLKSSWGKIMGEFVKEEVATALIQQNNNSKKYKKLKLNEQGKEH